MERFTGAGAVVFAIAIGCDSFRIFAHRARCAAEIFSREAFDIKRVVADVVPVGLFTFCGVPVPFSDSITAIAFHEKAGRSQVDSSLAS